MPTPTPAERVDIGKFIFDLGASMIRIQQERYSRAPTPEEIEDMAAREEKRNEQRTMAHRLRENP